MKLIIPMAGLGTRLRPHTITTPKPLLRIYGKYLIFHLISEIQKEFNEKFEEIAFVIGDFGKEVEKSLLKVAKDLGSKGSIYYQEKPLGTAHAVYCAEKVMDNQIVIAFADTLFKSNLSINSNDEGLIWVKEVDDPSSYGVVITKGDYIERFEEKPKKPVSNKAIIGIYYFKDGSSLKKEIENLIENDKKIKGEFQLTDALENLGKKGTKIKVGIVDKWMDCGNKDNLLETNKSILIENGTFIGKKLKKENSIIIDPCYIDDGVEITNSIVGPNVSIEKECKIVHSMVSNTMIMQRAIIKNSNIGYSIIGQNSVVEGREEYLNIGDYSTIYEL